MEKVELKHPHVSLDIEEQRDLKIRENLESIFIRFPHFREMHPVISDSDVCLKLGATNGMISSAFLAEINRAFGLDWYITTHFDKMCVAICK